MTTRLIAVALVVAAGAATATARQSPATAPNTVWIAANAIHRDGRLVPNLTVVDFDVTVDGRATPIVTFRNDALPVAVAIMIDISASMETNYGLARRAVSALTAHFAPGDRAVIGAFNALPWIGSRFSARPDVLQKSLNAALGGRLFMCDGDWIDKTSVSRYVSSGSRAGKGAGFGAVTEFARRTRINGGSAIWDGAACGVNAVSSDGETPRRIVVLMTDGVDNMSSSTVASVVSRANRAGVMIYAVSMMGGYGMTGGALKGLAEATGGGYFHLTGEDGITDAFTRISDELRHQYVFSVEGRGSPVISVSSRAPDTTVRFRQVMMESAGGKPLSAMGAPATSGDESVSSALPRSLSVTRRPDTSTAGVPAAAPRRARTPFWDTLDAFTRSDWPAGTAARMRIDDMRNLAGVLKRDGEDWIAAAPPSDQPHRRLAAASYVLDLLYTQNDPYVWLDGQPVPDLLEWASRTLQASPPLPEERLWYFGAAALAERAGTPDLLERLAQRALRRFPDEGRFVLAQAIAIDLRTWPEERDVKVFSATPAIAATLVASYERAVNVPSVKDEASLRLGFFDIRRGRTAAGLARLQTIDAASVDDGVLRFWIHLIKGRALDQLNRLEEAAAEFEEALEDVPGATSARAALIAVQAKRGLTAAASRLAAEALTVPAASVDPWTMYVLPDMRYWDAIQEQLRQAVVR